MSQQWVKRQVEGIRPIDKIESIIREDSKVTTYKFALLRALSELSLSSRHLVQWKEKRVWIPVEPIVHLWMEG